MKKNMTLKFIFVSGVVICSSFFYGAAVGVWNIFPYFQIAGMFELVEKNAQKILNAESSQDIMNVKSDDQKQNSLISSSGFGSEIIIPRSIVLSQLTLLNNFELKWGRIDDENLNKVGAVIYKGDRVWYVNQKENKLLDRLKLSDKTTYSGGVKAIFSVADEQYAYVAYSDGGCASARIYNLKNDEIALQLPCLPNPNLVDLAGVGGGWLKLNDNEILLSTGTPSGISAYVSLEINQIAQDPESPWGKILKLSFVNGQINASIYTSGHRNPQGLAEIDGIKYAVEHGPRGGDEINVIEEGANYGWPIQSFGSEYDLTPINNNFEKLQKSKKPLFSFVPSIGISYVGKCPVSYSEYYSPNLCTAISSMRGNSIFLLIHDGEKAHFYERMDFESRIRKFRFEGDSLIAATDFAGLIIGKFGPAAVQ